MLGGYLEIKRIFIVSDNAGSASKIILATLVLAIAVLSYFLFSQNEHQPIELSDEAKSSFLDDSDEPLSAAEIAHSTDTLPESNYPNAEPTKLELTLLGVVASNIETESSATIQSRLQVRTYFIEDQIAYTNAIIKEIRNDRVVLDNDGKIEVLRLQGTKTSEGDISTNNETRETTEQDQSLEQAIGNRPKELEHIVRLVPVDENNSSQGYSVVPGLNPKLFRAARFQPGDVLQTVNGIDVNTEEGLEQIQQLIPNAMTLVFSVLRGGRTINLYLDIPSEGLNIKKN
ncbi:type II secretion system protein GspC [Aliiglaciecola sp. M165]|nr:type II secretion system protein GspC [Aliiglaciecola sp. M165]